MHNFGEVLREKGLPAGGWNSILRRWTAISKPAHADNHCDRNLIPKLDPASNSRELWNAACLAGADAVWRRPATSMVPVARAPSTFAPVWPIVSNTQGGPVHDARQRVLDPAGQPIAGLYAAGERVSDPA